jgi:hypothetical protein
MSRPDQIVLSVAGGHAGRLRKLTTQSSARAQPEPREGDLLIRVRERRVSGFSFLTALGLSSNRPHTSLGINVLK